MEVERARGPPTPAGFALATALTQPQLPDDRGRGPGIMEEPQAEAAERGGNLSSVRLLRLLPEALQSTCHLWVQTPAPLVRLG